MVKQLEIYELSSICDYFLCSGFMEKRNSQIATPFTEASALKNLTAVMLFLCK